GGGGRPRRPGTRELFPPHAGALRHVVTRRERDGSQRDDYAAETGDEPQRVRGCPRSGRASKALKAAHGPMLRRRQPAPADWGRRLARVAALDEHEVDPDPLRQLIAWYEEAVG